MGRSRSESTTAESTRLLEAVPKLRALADDGSEPDNGLPFSFLWEHRWIGFSFFQPFLESFIHDHQLRHEWVSDGGTNCAKRLPRRYTANLLRLRRINWNFPKKWHIHGDKQLFYVVQACNIFNFVVPICPVGVLEHEQNKHIQIPCVEQEPLDYLGQQLSRSFPVYEKCNFQHSAWLMRIWNFHSKQESSRN